MDNRTFAGLLAATAAGGPEHHRAHGGAHTARRLLRPGRRGRTAEGRGDGLHPGPGLRRRHGAPAGGDAVASCSAGVERSCRKTPAASAVAAGAGHAYRVRRRLRMVRGAGAPPLSPGGGGGAFGPRRTSEGGALRQSLRGAALPPLRAGNRVLDGGRRRTSVVLAAEGHPLRPDGLRLRRPPRDVERLPGRPLGHGPPGQATRRLLRRPRRAAGGLAGVGRRAHPARDAAQSPPGRHTPG